MTLFFFFFFFLKSTMLQMMMMMMMMAALMQGDRGTLVGRAQRSGAETVESGDPGRLRLASPQMRREESERIAENVALHSANLRQWPQLFTWNKL